MKSPPRPRAKSPRPHAAAGRRRRRPQRPFPHTSVAVTAAMIGWSVLAHAWVIARPDAMTSAGYANAFDIWDGASYGLFTNAFLHVGMIHLLFNIWWIWKLGSAMEMTLGAPRYAAFVAVAAVAASGGQLAISGEAGVGLSGVVYAMVAYMWIARRRIPWFRFVDDNLAKFFAGWFALCLLLTWTGYWPVGNAAHATGAAFGAATALLFVLHRHRPVAVASFAAIGALLVLSLTWCPWAPPWRVHRAYAALVDGDHARAEQLLTEIVDADATNSWAIWNRAVVRRELGRADEADADFRRARELDPSIGR